MTGNNVNVLDVNQLQLSYLTYLQLRQTNSHGSTYQLLQPKCKQRLKILQLTT